MAGFEEHVVHIDMDAFFVEVERLRRPELIGKPVLVGGSGNRGVVAAASYEARKRGAKSAMPMSLARRLVPSAIVVPPSHREYGAVSAGVFELLDEFSPVVEPLSVDEAFVDIAGLRHHYRTPQQCGEAMRSAIRNRLGLPSSVGIATSKFLAKMASRAAKPDGLLVVVAGGELEFLHPKPIEELWGVGEATQARIEELGIRTIGEMASYPRDTLIRRLGEAVGGSLWDLAKGRDTRLVGETVRSRSISVEQTYDQDLIDVDAMERELLRHSDRLASRLRRAHYVASTIHVKVRYPDFTTVNRSHSFPAPVMTSADIYAVAVSLLHRTGAAARGVRLLGVGAEGLHSDEEPRQLGLDSDTWEVVDEAVEKVRDRFGTDAVGRARLRERDHSGADSTPARNEGRSV